MEYPDKDRYPIEYINTRLDELRKSHIPIAEREWAYKAGGEVIAAIDKLDNFDVEDGVLYIVDAVETICNLIWNRENHEYEAPLVQEIIEEIRKFRENIFEMEKITERLKKVNGTLEVKVVSKDLIKHMKEANSSKENP
jgi:hypothetical protein